MSDQKYKKENLYEVRFRMSKSSAEYEAMMKACELSGDTAISYARKAVAEKLQRDGYLSQEQEKN